MRLFSGGRQLAPTSIILEAHAIAQVKSDMQVETCSTGMLLKMPHTPRVLREGNAPAQPIRMRVQLLMYKYKYVPRSQKSSLHVFFHVQYTEGPHPDTRQTPTSQGSDVPRSTTIPNTQTRKSCGNPEWEMRQGLFRR